MSNIMSVLVAIYRLLIRLYPRSYHEEFGAEMVLVFQDQLMEAATHGRAAWLQICWRELRDWPVHCFQAHWQARQQRLLMDSAASSSWWDTAVASAPYFLFALFLSSSAFIFLLGQTTGLFFYLLSGYGFVFVLLLVLIIAWWRGWPNWSVAWLGFLFFVLFVLILPTLFFNFLQQSSLQIIVMEVGWPLLWLAVLYVFLGRWPRAGLVAMLPTFGMAWFLYLEFVPEGARMAVMLITWGWLGIMAMVLLRGRRPAWDVWLLYLTAFVTCLLYIVAGHFLTEPQVRDRTLVRMSDDLLSELLPTLMPLVAVLLLHTLRLWGRVNGRTALTTCRLLSTAVLFMLLGVQANQQLPFRTGSFAWHEGVGVGFTAVFLIGCLLMVLAIWRLARNRSGYLAVGRSFWLLIGLIIFIPLIYRIGVWSVLYGSWMYQQGAQDFQGMAEALRLTGRALELVWLLLAAWAIGRVGSWLPSPMPPQVAAEEGVTAVAVPTHSKMSKRQGFYLVAGLLLLLALLLPATTLAYLFPNDEGNPLALSTALALYLLQTIGLIVVAILLASGVHRWQAGGRKTAVLFGGLSMLLLITAVRYFYWLTVWDNTYDPLSYFWLFIPILGVFLVAIWLAFTLPHKAKWVSALYLFFVPAVMIITSAQAQRVDFRQLTENRAARVNQAIVTYHTQHGRYPETLRQLTPRYLLTLSEPVIIFGQEWCYEGDADQYRLGYVYREHWSDPRLVGRIHHSTYATTSALPPLCEQEIMALQMRDPQYYGLR